MTSFRAAFGNCLRRINRKKPLDEDYLTTELNRCLGIKDLTMLGLSGMLGAGLYVLTGTVARNTAGPAVVVSYVIAASAAFLSALCYAEFGSKIPSTGSSYIFTYVTMGELCGFLMGWNMVLEHGIGSASVAKAWSGYLDSVLGYPIKNFMSEHLPLGDRPLGEFPDLVAVAIVLVLTVLVGIGAKSSTRFNLIFTIVNLLVVIFIIITGIFLSDGRNWTQVEGGFVPFGFTGVLSGASRCFFAYAGFDVIASSCEEARHPRRDIPIALALSLFIVTVSYIGVSTVLTLMVPWYEILPKSAIPDAYARHEGWQWAQIIVTCGSLCTMTTSMFSGLFVLPRILYAIAKDGLLCSSLAKINPTTQVPLWAVGFTSILCSVMALLFDLETLVQFMSIGTLMSYSFVAACVILLRYGAVGETSLVQLSTPGKSHEAGHRNGGPISISEDAPVDKEASDSTHLTARAKFPVGETSHLMTSSTAIDRAELPQIEHPADSASTHLISRGQRSRTQLKPQYRALERWLAPFHTDSVILAGLSSSVASAGVGMLVVVYALPALVGGAWWAWSLTAVCGGVAGVGLFVVFAHQPRAAVESGDAKSFRVPFVPFLPYLCICTNIFLMLKLQSMTWFRLVIWIIVGLAIYFTYGYHKSLLNPNRAQPLWLENFFCDVSDEYGRGDRDELLPPPDSDEE